jgi:3-carboxy-cis,cis-muconate cycloisomerase
MDTLSSHALTGTSCDPYVSREPFLAAILRFEAALAQAQASLGLIPSDAAAAIEAAIETASTDVNAIAAAGYAAGTPIVAVLDRVRSRLEDRHAKHLHHGATSQDALDTAMVLCVKPCVELALVALARARDAAMRLGREHASSPVLARTLMQAAGVTTFGFKAAQWAASLARAEHRIRSASVEALRLQLAGPIGTSQSFGERAAELNAAVSAALRLAPAPAGGWHATRDAWVNLLLQLALAAQSAAKAAGDIALMCQTEIGEAHDPSASAGVSSAMPHKRNPVLCMRIRACAHVIEGLTAGLVSTMQIEHERALGAWQAEQAMTPSLVAHGVSALESLAALLEGVRFDVDRARQNIDAVRAIVPGDTFGLERNVEAAARETARILESAAIGP